MGIGVMAGPGLLVNIDTTYLDAGDASVPIHQRDHDKIHATVNAIDKDTLPSTPVMLAGVVANNQTGTTYTLVLADAGKVVELNNAATVSLLVPTNASVAFPIGTCIELWQQGLGQVIVAAASGATTIRAPVAASAIAAQYGSASLRKRATDEWCLEGNIVPSSIGIVSLGGTGVATDTFKSVGIVSLGGTGVATDTFTVSQSGGIALDAFDRADGALGTADTGGAWAVLSGTWAISGNRAKCSAGSNDLVAMLPVGTVALTGAISADVYMSSTLGNTGLVFKSTDQSSCYWVQLVVSSGGANSISLYKTVVGTPTVLAQIASGAGLVNGQGYTVAVTFTTTTATVYVDGVSRLSYTFSSQDNIDLPNGRVGMRTWTGEENFGSSWDNFRVVASTALPQAIPAAPLAPIAAAIDATSASVAWIKAGNGGSALTSYTITSSAGPVFTGISSAATSFTCTGLTSVAQTFTVTAINAVGSRTSSASNSVTPHVFASTSVQVWLTTADQAHLLERQSDLQTQSGSGGATVSVDSSQSFQVIDGFGAAVTESSAYLLNTVLTAPQRATAMQSLFDPATGAGLSYVRVPIGSSDFALSSYTEDDMSAGQVDPTLSQFSIARDLANVIPVIKAAQVINPRLSVMGSPWSAPAWMKTSQSLIGGTLNPTYFGVYAQYLVRVIQAYAAQGVQMDAITVQNEPGFSPTGYPGMLLSVADEITFVRDYLGPAFAGAGLTTKIIGYDHNWDNTSYALTLLADSGANQYLAGTAYHCYAGDPSAQTPVHNAYPNKGIYFTECSGGEWSPLFADNLAWDVHTLMIESVRNWAKTVILWNLALDQFYGPQNGGCANCRGVVMISQADHSVTRNVEFYILAHAAKFVVPGAVRIASTTSGSGGVESVAYCNPNGSYVLLLLNSAATLQSAVIDTGSGRVTFSMPVGAVVTMTWS